MSTMLMLQTRVLALAVHDEVWRYLYAVAEPGIAVAVAGGGLLLGTLAWRVWRAGRPVIALR